MQPCSYYALVVAMHDLHLDFCRQCKTPCQTNQVFSLYFRTLLASQHAMHHAGLMKAFALAFGQCHSDFHKLLTRQSAGLYASSSRLFTHGLALNKGWAVP